MLLMVNFCVAGGVVVLAATRQASGGRGDHGGRAGVISAHCNGISPVRHHGAAGVFPIPGGSLATGSLVGNLGQRIHYRTAAITHGNRDIGFDRHGIGDGGRPDRRVIRVRGDAADGERLRCRRRRAGHGNRDGAVAVVNATPLVVVPCMTSV